MKKILSLLLVVAMLLSVAPMTWAADQDVGTATDPVYKASLTLKDSIAINFKVTRAYLVAEGCTKAVFTVNDEEIQTVAMPEGDSDLAVFTCDTLTPAQMADVVTVKFYAGDESIVSLSRSVLEYCNNELEKTTTSDLLKTALVDMLSYGAAAMTYNNQTVDEELQTALTTYASSATTAEPTLSNKTALTGEAGTVVWKSAGLNLKDAVTLRLKFSADSTAGLVLKLTCNGVTWEITNFYPVENQDGCYYAYFNGLNPAQLRDLITGQFFDANGDAVSNVLTYSVESYAAGDSGSDATLTALLKALMVYGDSVKTWAYTYTVGSDLTYIEAEDVLLYTGIDETLCYRDSTTKEISYLNTGVVSVVEDENASGGLVAKLDWTDSFTQSEFNNYGNTENPAHLSFNVKVQETGYYFVWVCYAVKGTTTIQHYVDGAWVESTNAQLATGWQYNLLGEDDYKSDGTTYVWDRVDLCNWTAGETYAVRLRGRQGNVSFDKFVVTKDASFAPHMTGELTTINTEVFVEAEDVTRDPLRSDLLTSTEGEVTTTSVNLSPVIVVDDIYYTSKNPGNCATPGIGFRVTAEEATTYYIWGYFDKSSTMYLTIHKTDDAYGYGYLKPADKGTVPGWVKIGTYTATEVGESFEVGLVGRQTTNGNVIDKFFVTTVNMTTPHEHTFSEDWSTDAGYHWHAATCGCTDLVADKGAHVYDDDQDATCNTCNYEREIHIHTYSSEWTTDETYHWHAATCGCTDLVSDKAEHDYGTTGLCACGKVGFYVVGSDAAYIEAESVNLFTGVDSTCGNCTPVVVDNTVTTASGGAVARWNWTWETSSNKQSYVTYGDLPEVKPAHISFDVKATANVTYYVWVKVSHKTGSNVVVCIDNDDNRDAGWRYLEFTAAADSSTFVWQKVATCTADADGVYSVRFRARNGGSAYFDQFVVTTDSTFTPT